MRVFLDANILFSACCSAGAIRNLLRTLEDRGHVLVANLYVAEEARRNLARKGPPQSLATLDALLARTEVAALRQPQPGVSDVAWLADKDRPVLLAAIAQRCDALVTGDKEHFGMAYGQRHGGVRICSAAQLFELL
jgi:uncharacterized protein